MENKCPDDKCIGVLNLIHTLHTVPVTLVGYCSECKKTFYKKPDGTWVNEKEFRKFCDEFH
jgi:hypothetical protein